jgi:hypothetical protein
MYRVICQYGITEVASIRAHDDIGDAQAELDAALRESPQPDDAWIEPVPA